MARFIAQSLDFVRRGFLGLRFWGAGNDAGLDRVFEEVLALMAEQVELEVIEEGGDEWTVAQREQGLGVLFTT